jgi:hypothetical protein
LFSVIDPRFYSPAFIPGFDYFTVMCDPVQQSGGHLVDTEEVKPEEREEEKQIESVAK